MDHESEITPIRDGELGLEKLTRISRLARGRCIAAGPPNVRYAPESDRLLRCQQMTRWAKSDLICTAENSRPIRYCSIAIIRTFDPLEQYKSTA